MRDVPFIFRANVVQQLRIEREDLRDLDSVGQARAKMIALMVKKDLGLMRQTAKRGGMDDSVAVALKFRTGRGWRLDNVAGANTWSEQ